MGMQVDRAPAPTGSDIAHARDPHGRFVQTGEELSPHTAVSRASKKRMLNERDYMRRIVETFTLDDIEKIIASVKRDAEGGADVDVKVVNASREWLGKYLLGNARVSLDDCERQPAIVKRR